MAFYSLCVSVITDIFSMVTGQPTGEDANYTGQVYVWQGKTDWSHWCLALSLWIFQDLNEQKRMPTLIRKTNISAFSRELDVVQFAYPWVWLHILLIIYFLAYILFVFYPNASHQLANDWE